MIYMYQEGFSGKETSEKLPYEFIVIPCSDTYPAVQITMASDQHQGSCTLTHNRLTVEHISNVLDVIFGISFIGMSGRDCNHLVVQ